MDAIVHLAQSRRDRDFPEGTDDVVALSVGATAGLLDHARRHGIRRFLLTSTATVYARSNTPLTEDSALDCSSFYAASKRCAELLLGAYREQLSGVALRVFTLYGPGQRGRLIPELVRRIRAGEPVELEGDHGLLLSPIHVDDLAAAIHGLLGAGEREAGYELVNVAGEEALGIREIAERIGAAVGAEPVFETASDAEPGGLIADCTKLRRMLPDFQPTPFEMGIRELVSASARSG